MASKKGRPAPRSAWKKGQSGNPLGAPKKEWTWAGTVRQVAEREKDGKTVKLLVAEALAKEAQKGNVPAIKEWGDRLDGRAQQALDLTTGGEKIKGIAVGFEENDSEDNTSEGI